MMLASGFPSGDVIVNDNLNVFWSWDGGSGGIISRCDLHNKNDVLKSRETHKGGALGYAQLFPVELYLILEVSLCI